VHGIKNTGKAALHYLTANPAFGPEKEKQLWPEIKALAMRKKFADS